MNLSIKPNVSYNTFSDSEKTLFSDIVKGDRDNLHMVKGTYDGQPCAFICEVKEDEITGELKTYPLALLIEDREPFLDLCEINDKPLERE